MEFMWKENGLFSGISGRGEWKRNGDKFIFEMEFEWNGMELELEWNGNGIKMEYVSVTTIYGTLYIIVPVLRIKNKKIRS